MKIATALALMGAALRWRLERLAIRLDGKPLAMLATFLCSPGAFSFKTAFDESFARFSPGVLLQRENLELLARADIDWVDSCAAEIPSDTPYMYSCYEGDGFNSAQCEMNPTDRKKVVILGGGAEPHRPGDRIRLLLRPCLLRAERSRV